MARQAVSTCRIERLRERLSATLLSFEFARSSGPGGQNVNKVNTQVALWFDVAGSAILTGREKNVIRRALGTRITGEGWLRIVSRRHRTQRANRRAVIERFYELLAIALAPRRKRVPTRVSAGQKRRRREEKRRTSEKKLGRGPRSVVHED